MLKNYTKYLATTDLEEKWGFYVTTAGYTKTDIHLNYPDNREHPADHSFTWNRGRILNGYYLVFISKGQGIFESSHTEPYSIKAGTCFFLFPGVWHRYKPDPDSGWEEYWIGFKGSYPTELMKNNFFNPDTPFIEVGLNETLLMLFHQLLENIQLRINGYQQIISGVTLQILGIVNAISMHDRHDNDPIRKLTSNAKFLLQESLEAPVKMEELAKQLSIGYSKFRKSFKDITGLSPNQYHLELRLKKAKELLTSTTLSVSEIAYKTGFESVFYFSKIFKKKMGVSPKFYRLEE